MIYTKEQIDSLDRVGRLRLINAVTGIKPANLIGTISDDGLPNLAIFSSVVHLGSDPALIGFISRPQTADVGHTYANILENGQYTINHIHPEMVKKAHYTSAKFHRNISEFERCSLTEEYLDDFKAPYVRESSFKLGMCFKESLDIKRNGTVLVIGEITQLIIPETAINDGDIDLEAARGVGISGLNSYYALRRIGKYPYARVAEVPEL